MSRVRLLFSEAWSSVTANLSTTFAATMTVLIAMFLLGVCIGLGTWVLSWSHHVKRELVVHVYFCTPLTCDQEATSRQETLVMGRAQRLPGVKHVRFVSKENALKEMRRKAPTITQHLTSNPLPDSLEIVPTDGDRVASIASQLRPPPPGVEKVNYGRKTAQRVITVTKVIEIVFLVAVVLLVVAATLLIANTIRLSIFARRREVEVMKLVGATNWFVRGPFMIEGLLCGLAGSLVAILLLGLGKTLVLSHLPRLANSPDVRALPFALNALALVLAGLMLGAFGSGLTLRRFLRV